MTSGKGYRREPVSLSTEYGVPAPMPGAGAKPGRTWDCVEAADVRWDFMMPFGVVAGTAVAVAVAVLRCWMLLSGVSDIVCSRAGGEGKREEGGWIYMMEEAMDAQERSW